MVFPSFDLFFIDLREEWMIQPGVSAGDEDCGSQVRAAPFAHFRFTFEGSGFDDFRVESGESQQLPSPVFTEAVDAADFGDDGGGGQNPDSGDAGQVQIQFAVDMFDVDFQPLDLVFQQYHLFQQHFDLKMADFLTPVQSHASVTSQQ